MQDLQTKGEPHPFSSSQNPLHCPHLLEGGTGPCPGRREESGQAPPCSRGLPNGLPQEAGDLPQLQAIGFPSLTLRPQQTCPLCPSLTPKPCSQLLDREASSAPEPWPPHPTQGSRQYPHPPLPVSDPPRARGQSLQLDRRWWVRGDVDQNRFTPATHPPSSRKPPTGLSGEAREQPSYGGNSPPQAGPDGELPFPRPDTVPHVGDVIPPSTSQTSWGKVVPTVQVKAFCGRITGTDNWKVAAG